MRHARICKVPTKITIAWLRGHRACDGDGGAFQDLFPEGAEVTFRNALACIQAGIDVGWLLHKVLPRAQYMSYENRICKRNVAYGRQLHILDEQSKKGKLSQRKYDKSVREQIEKKDRYEATLFMKAWRRKLPV